VVVVVVLRLLLPPPPPLLPALVVALHCRSRAAICLLRGCAHVGANAATAQSSEWLRAVTPATLRSCFHIR